MAETNEAVSPEVFFITAPVVETLCGLNALIHPHLRPFAARWAEEIEQKLTPEELRALALLRQLPEGFVLIDQAALNGYFQDPLEFAAWVAGWEPNHFAYTFLGGHVPAGRVATLRKDPNGPAKLRQEQPWIWGGETEVLRVIMHDTVALQRAYATLIPRVWELGIQPMLPTLEGYWAATIAQAQEEAEGRDPKSFAISVFSKPFGTRFGPDHVFARYTFIPSYFASPRKLALFNAEAAFLTLDCRLGPWSLVKARSQVMDGLKALTEENRLEILRLLLMQKGFGGWVAGRLKLKPATVTHHIAILRKAGLLVEEEGPPGAARYYRTNRDAIERLITLLQNFLDSNLDPNWDGGAKDGDSDQS